MSNASTRRSLGIRSLAAVLLLAGTALAQPAAQQPPRDTELLRDFIHYVRIDRADLAKARGEALLARIEKPLGNAEAGKGLKLSEFVKLLEDSGELARFEESAAGAMRRGELESVAGRLLKAYETGKLAQARSAEEITRNIGMLTGAQRERLIARERLAAAGEYSVPQLLAAMLKRNDPALGAEAKMLLADMGRQSVMPLLAALPKLDPAGQEQVVGVLAEIPYRTSVPMLYELHASTSVDAVKKACERAIARIDQAVNPEVPVSQRYLELAEAFYANTDTTLSFPKESHQLMWTYDPSAGLSMTPVRTEVYHEAAAMASAERGLKLDAKNDSLLALWLAANFKREFDTPRGYANPAYANDRREAMYYAVAAGAGPSKRVLARAIDQKSAPLARKAIAALDQTSGAASLVSIEGGRNPLVEALRYPNRRVQYEAALAIAAALPNETFDGCDRVVPILGGAIRDAGVKFAAVIAARPEQQQSLANVARGLGYTVLPAGNSLDAVALAVTDAPGVDLVLVSLPAESAAAAIDGAHASAKMGAAPVLAVLSVEGVNELGAKYAPDSSVTLLREGASPAQQAEAVKQLVERVQGGDVTEEEAKSYQQRALTALRDLAVSNNAVLNVIDAAPPMLGALGSAKGGLKLQIAGVLAHVDDKRVQAALLDAALTAEGDDRIALLGAVAQSAKRFGRLADDKQVQRLVSAASAAGLDDRQATAFAGAIGALGVSNESIIPLILGTPAKK